MTTTTATAAIAAFTTGTRGDLSAAAPSATRCLASILRVTASALRTAVIATRVPAVLCFTDVPRAGLHAATAQSFRGRTCDRTARMVLWYDRRRVNHGRHQRLDKLFPLPQPLPVAVTPAVHDKEAERLCNSMGATESSPVVFL